MQRILKSLFKKIMETLNVLRS